MSTLMYTLLCGVLVSGSASSQAPAADSLMVRLRDASGMGMQSEFRVAPSTLAANVSLGGQEVSLSMEKMEEQQSNVPLYVLQSDSGGRMEMTRKDIETKVTFYRDTERDALFGIVHRRTLNGTTLANLEGIINTGRRIYDIRSKPSALQEIAIGASRENGINRDLDLDFSVREHQHSTQHLEDFAVRKRRDPVSTSSERLPLVRSRSGPKEPDHHQSAAGGHKRRATTSRRKRAVSQDVFLDVVAFADYGVYSSWYGRSTGTTTEERKKAALNSIYQYYSFVFSGINMMYGSIKSLSYRINIKLSAIIVATDSGSAPFIENNRQKSSGVQWDIVNTYNALDNLTDWIAASDSLPPHDHLMLFSGYELIGERGTRSLLGLAWQAGLCATDGSSASIIEDKGAFQCIGTAAHELGHSINAVHDGTNNVCNSNDAYIMSAGSYDVTQSNELNQWKFSPCTPPAFDAFFSDIVRTSRGSRCVYYPELTRPEVADVTSKMPGQVYGVDQQCQQIYGAQSYLCRTVDALLVFGVSNVCTSLMCQDPSKANSCTIHIAARGTTCGHQKWCVDGRCVDDTAAPNVTNNCPLGDQPGAVHEGKTCAELIRTHPGNCYDVFFKKACCATCAKASSDAPGCEYGDSVEGCQTYHCAIRDNLPLCCRTCAPPTSPRTTTTTTTPRPTTRRTTTVTSKTARSYVTHGSSNTAKSLVLETSWLSVTALVVLTLTLRL